MKIIKYLRALLVFTIGILILSLIITTTSFFNIIDFQTSNYLKLFSIAVSMYICGLYIGKYSSSKGYLEGLKMSVIIIMISLLLGCGLFKKPFSFKVIIYYFIMMISCVLGSVIGINKKSKNLI